MPWTEKLPNGEDAILAALPDSWKRIFKRRGALDEQDGPAIADRVVKPEWASNSNPQEISAPYASNGPLVSGRDPGEMIVARGGGNAAPQEPIAAPPEFTRSRRALPPASPVPDLPILPKTVSGMSVPDVRGGDAIGKAMPVDPNQMPEIPSRNFSQYVLAPDQTKNPDYTPETIATRPKVVDELGYAETHTPMPRHGRLYETGKGALLGFLRGVGTTGTLGGGLGGAATLGTMSAIDPKYAESAQNQMFTIPRLQQQEAIRVGRNEQALKQRGQAADINLKNSQAYKNLHPQITPHYETRANGTYVVDSQNPEGRLLRGVPGKPSTTRPKTEWIGGVLNAYDENGVPAPVMRDGKPVTSREKTPIQVKMSDGSDVWVTPAEALSADAVRGRTEREGFRDDVTAENENAALQASQQNEAAQREWQNKHDSWTQTKADVAEFNALVGQREAAQRQLQALSNQELELKKDGYSLSDAQEIQAQEAQSKIADIGAQLEAKRPLMSGDYAELDSNGRFKLKPEPSRPSPVNRAPVRSRRMPAQQSTAPPISEDAFVEAARQKMGRSFDEGKARAAWQKKYGGH